jgi:iron complex outermembrane receptor protein
MGIEFEGSARFGDATVLSAQVGWLDAEYDRFEDFRLDPSYPGFDPNLNHDHVPFSPDLTARIALQQGFSLGDAGNLGVGVDASYRSKTWLSVDNREVLSQGAYTLYGAFGVWDSPQYTWQVRAGVRNLTDEVYKTEGQEFASVGNIQTAYYGLPRNWYMSVRYNF